MKERFLGRSCRVFLNRSCHVSVGRSCRVSLGRSCFLSVGRSCFVSLGRLFLEFFPSFTPSRFPLLVETDSSFAVALHSRAEHSGKI